MFQQTEGAVKYGGKYVNSHVAHVLELPMSQDMKNAATAVINRDMDTSRYHCLGTPSQVGPSDMPAGATLGSFLKLVVVGADKVFNFYALRIEEKVLQHFRSHASGVVSTMPLPKYSATAKPGCALDAERVRSIALQSLAAILMIGSMEAYIAHDPQKGTALGMEGVLVLANNCSWIEAERVKSNSGSTALLDMLANTNEVLNPALQALVTNAELHAQRIKLIMSRVGLPSGEGGQFFRSGGGGGTLLSAPQDAYNPTTTVLPYNPTLVGGTRAETGGAAATNQPTQWQAAQSTTHTNDPPNTGSQVFRGRRRSFSAGPRPRPIFNNNKPRFVPRQSRDSYRESGHRDHESSHHGHSHRK
jgi:hypothetical protein